MPPQTPPIAEAIYHHLQQQRPHDTIELSGNHITITTASTAPKKLILTIYEDCVRIIEVITTYEPCGQVDLNNPNGITNLEQSINRIINYTDSRDE